MTSSNFVIMHIDVNSAYLSWEAMYRLQQGDKIDLRTIPSVVGGDPKKRHGVVLAKSIPAKKYKIKTGESLFSALQKCPNLTIVPSHHELYMECSNNLMRVLEEYSPIIQRYSIDECFLDYTHMECHFGDPVSAAYSIKNRIKKDLGFTVNIGVSHNKLLAKMASDFTKPDAVHTLFPHEIREKMWPLPVEELFMVGGATASKLYNLGIYTIGDLARANPRFLSQHFKSQGILIWNFANGIESSPIIGEDYSPIKGISNSTTVSSDIIDRKTAHKILLSLAENVAMRLREEKYYGELVSISIKSSDFRHYSHQRKIGMATDSTHYIYRYACSLFDEAWKGEPIRSLGIRVSELCNDESCQMSLFNTSDIKKQQAIDKSIDDLRKKFGSKAVFRASQL
ncbi:MAG: DNA polymerase IV [Epulopiscium sp.]|nr:DNA polymerase IV [Candidatus Epulonipiscium sp.]